MRALYWLRNDLRQADNLCWDWLTQNCQTADFLYCLDRELQPDTHPKDRFLHECLEALHQTLESQGRTLHRRVGPAAQVVPDWIQQQNIEVLIYTSEFNSRDREVEGQIQDKIPATCRIQKFDQRSLIPLQFTESRSQPLDGRQDPLQDLQEMSDRFTPFYKGLSTLLLELESKLPSHPPRPSKIEVLPQFRGGEEAAWAHLNHYLDVSQAVRHYKETRNGMEVWSDSSKLSPWLARGCLSARQVFCAIRRHERMFGVCESTTALIYELIWRDFFKFQALKHGPRIFDLEGPAQNQRPKWKSDQELFKLWTDGETESPFVNANMNELRLAGWMSNRGRQNVASYLAKTLHIDWRWGAQWFSKHLIDDDCESNWGNWNYVSGVGFDPKARVFNVEWQAQTYDPTGSYRLRWLQASKR